MYGEQAAAFARRLRAHAQLRAALATALGVELQEFDERAPGALDAAHAMGQFGGDRSAAQILRTGNE